jgi:hypothetical protein
VLAPTEDRDPVHGVVVEAAVQRTAIPLGLQEEVVRVLRGNCIKLVIIIIDTVEQISITATIFILLESGNVPDFTHLPAVATVSTIHINVPPLDYRWKIMSVSFMHLMIRVEVETLNILHAKLSQRIVPPLRKLRTYHLSNLIARTVYPITSGLSQRPTWATKEKGIYSSVV